MGFKKIQNQNVFQAILSNFLDPILPSPDFAVQIWLHTFSDPFFVSVFISLLKPCSRTDTELI